MMTDRPWKNDPASREALHLAGWRYAVLIGLIDPEHDDVPAEIREQDRERYGHMVKPNPCGAPAWYVEDALELAQAVTGAPREVCAECLDRDWPGPKGFRHMDLCGGRGADGAAS